MGRVLEEATALDPGRAALIIEGQVTTYGELSEAVGRVAAGLRETGVQPGWRIPLVDDASVLSVATLIAAPTVGAATALMNPRLTSRELDELMRAAATAPVAVAGPAYADVVRGTGVRSVLGTEDLLRGGSGVDGSAGPDPDRRSEAVLIFTSGTTGRPKAVPLSHGLMGPRIATYSPQVDPVAAVTMLCVPLVHIGGMLGLMVALAKGSTVVVQTRFSPGDWLELVERHGVQSAFVVPTMLHRILDDPAFDRTDLSSLVALSYGAAPASPDLIHRAMEALPKVALTNTFGQTETLGSITALLPQDLARGKEASVGRPLPGVEVRVVDALTGEPVPTGTVGELWVRTEASVIPESSGTGDGPAVPEGWLRTGDMVSVDEDGYLYPAGRLSDTINRGGEKFAPLEIETVLHEHPGVRDVAVIGVPDPEMGQRVGVAVVLAEPVTGEELREFCRGRIASFKLPERFAFVDEIPYNDFGKVARKQVRTLFADGS